MDETAYLQKKHVGVCDSQKRSIGCKWVFAVKDGVSGSKGSSTGIRYKARFMAKGYAQKKGEDYNEVFSPVVKHISIRVLFALVAYFHMELEQMDVKIGFLHGDVKEDIYMLQSEGYVVGKDHICKLKKSVVQEACYLRDQVKGMRGAFMIDVCT